MKHSKKIDSIEEIKKIQLDVLNTFHNYCIKNSINYSLAYGTLLGAIRHKGYIPWDDDIDICMLREDYEKFERVFPENYYDKYEFYTLKRYEKWNRPYGKLFNNQTIEFEGTKDDVGIGVSIDIFPIDDVPDKDVSYCRFRKKCNYLIKIRTIKAMVWTENRSLLKNLIVLFSHILLIPFSFRFIAILTDFLSKRQNNKGYNHVFHSCDNDTSKLSYPKNIFKEYVDVPFENYVLRAMTGYDDYLRACYGDYMQLPPVDKRTSTHTSHAFWK